MERIAEDRCGYFTSSVRHGFLSGGTFTEYSNQRADYTYDQGQNGLGRLTAVSFGRNDLYSGPSSLGFSYAYAYNQAGRVIGQGMSTSVFNPKNPYYPTGLNPTAPYQWDNEGRMTSTTYPVEAWPGWGTPTAPVYAYQYDNVGRLNGMTLDTGDGNGPQTEATAGYGLLHEFGHTMEMLVGSGGSLFKRDDGT